MPCGHRQQCSKHYGSHSLPLCCEMDNTLLRTFLETADAGSLSRAARTLSLSQPSLTAQIQRLEQHLGTINGGDNVVQDRTVFEDAGIFARNLFASGHMDSRDWSTYGALYAGILPALRVPDLLVHIKASLPTLRARIATRGRDFEQGITDEYLERLNWLYREWVEGYTHSSVVQIDGDTQDFVHDPAAFADICSRIEAQGLHLPLLRSSTD